MRAAANARLPRPITQGVVRADTDAPNQIPRTRKPHAPSVRTAHAAAGGRARVVFQISGMGLGGRSRRGGSASASATNAAGAMRTLKGLASATSAASGKGRRAHGVHSIDHAHRGCRDDDRHWELRAQSDHDHRWLGPLRARRACVRRGAKRRRSGPTRKVRPKWAAAYRLTRACDISFRAIYASGLIYSHMRPLDVAGKAQPRFFSFTWCVGRLRQDDQRACAGVRPPRVFRRFP